MTATNELLSRARKLNRSAIRELLGNFYPAVHRIAYALSGREDVGRGAVQFVMSKSLHVLSGWRQEGIPSRWFYHYTVLTIRRAARYKPDPRRDTLIDPVNAPNPGYIAFIRVLRDLPIQQKEAYILHHGERMDIRQLAVAMDCSMEAAANHLRAATDALAAFAGETAEAHAAELHKIHMRLSPSEELVLPIVRRYIRGYIWKKRLKRGMIWLMILAILGGAAWAYWRWDSIFRNTGF